MDWNDLRYGLAVGEAGSLAGAARSLGVNHSTVFRRLNALEKDLGVRLFERLPSGYVPTVAGEEFLHSVQRVEQEVAAIERQVAGEDFKLRGNLRITTTEAIAEAYLTETVAAFCRIYTEIRVDLVVGYQLYDLSKREADIAIRPGIAPPEHLIARRLLKLRWGIYASAIYTDQFGSPQDTEAVAGHKVIGFTEDSPGLASFHWARDLADEGEIVFTSNNLLVQREAAAAGMGLGVLPVYIGDEDPRLQRLFLLADEKTLDLWMLTHPDLRHTARVKAFTDYILKSIESDRPRLEGARLD